MSRDAAKGLSHPSSRDARHREVSAQGPAMPVVTPEVAAFCTGGVSIVIGVVGADGRPVASRAEACRVDPGGPVRLIFSGTGNDDLLAAVRQGGPIAATFSDPRTNRSLQIKGSRLVAARVVPADLEALERQVRAFAEALQAIGYSRAFGEAYCKVLSGDANAASFEPVAAFEQTPGPTAGAEL
jgi:hypothetical protein